MLFIEYDDGRKESIHMMAKRLRNEGYAKEVARQMIKKAFSPLYTVDRKKHINLIMTYTRTFWKKAPT